MKRNPWLILAAGLLWPGTSPSLFASPDSPFIYPTGYSLLDGTAAVLVQPEQSLIPTTHGSLIHENDAVFVPTTAPLLNPLAAPLVPTGTSGVQ